MDNLVEQVSRIKSLMMINEGEVLLETAEEEAWELLGQKVPEIQNFVKELGYEYDEESVKKVTPYIERTSNTTLQPNTIPSLKNLANKPNDQKILNAIKQISGKPDAEQQYVELMQKRDAGEGRKRGYDVSGLVKSIKSGKYDSPVLLKLTSGVYVIGGRTRLYAALALNVPIKVKIIDSSTFSNK